MELHSPIKSRGISRKLWNLLRIAFFMIRKGIISKRKLIMDMGLMMKSRKVLGKHPLRNLIFHTSRNAMTPRHEYEYEFSCSNSPNPVLFHGYKRKHPYFPCINIQEEDDDGDDRRGQPIFVLPKIEYSPAYSNNNSRLDESDGEKLLSPLVSLSPFSVRVSNCSWDDASDGGVGEVDAEAEEFIRRFYEQLRGQSRTALLQYQENAYREMLARGSG